MQRGISPPKNYSPLASERPGSKLPLVDPTMGSEVVQGATLMYIKPTNDLGVKWILGNEELACLRSHTTMDECLLIF